MPKTAKQTMWTRRGDYFEHRINLPLVDEFEEDIDWSTASFEAKIKEYAETMEVLETFDISPLDVTDPLRPHVTLSLDQSVTAVLPEHWVWDFQETRNGHPRTPVGGPGHTVLDISP